MITLRPARERGHADFGWLDTRHTFSFGDYHDPRHLGFRALRVINDDRVAPARGFGTHPHRDMEIVSYVVDGALAHEDSTGQGSIIRPGEVQRMSAGTGVRHSEKNPSATEVVRFLQIWILPETKGIAPSYEQKSFPEAERRDRLRLVASRDGREGSLTVHQDAAIYAATLSGGATVSHGLAPGRHAWVQVVKGSIELGEHVLGEGDGAALSDEPHVEVRARDGAAEILVFDLS